MPFNRLQLLTLFCVWIFVATTDVVERIQRGKLFNEKLRFTCCLWKSSAGQRFVIFATIGGLMARTNIEIWKTFAKLNGFVHSPKLNKSSLAFEYHKWLYFIWILISLLCKITFDHFLWSIKALIDYGESSHRLHFGTIFHRFAKIN